MTLPFNTAAAGAALAVAAWLACPAPAQATPFVGQVMCGGFNFAPIGWLPMDGRLLPIAQYDVLFNLIGTTYGGDGQNTFALPDLRGRFVKHSGTGPGLPTYTLGQQGGAEQVTLSAAQLPAHTHTVTPLASPSAALVSPAGAVPGTVPRTTLYAPAPGNVAMGSGPTPSSSAGGSTPLPLMPPFITINCFIATEGVFPAPSRADAAGAAQPAKLSRGSQP